MSWLGILRGPPPPPCNRIGIKFWSRHGYSRPAIVSRLITGADRALLSSIGAAQVRTYITTIAFKNDDTNLSRVRVSRRPQPELASAAASDNLKPPTGGTRFPQSRGTGRRVLRHSLFWIIAMACSGLSNTALIWNNRQGTLNVMATPTFFVGLFAALAALTLVLFIIAQNIVEPDLKLDDPEVARIVQQRIEPIGRLNTGDAPDVVCILATHLGCSGGTRFRVRGSRLQRSLSGLPQHRCSELAEVGRPRQLGDPPTERKRGAVLECAQRPQPDAAERWTSRLVGRASPDGRRLHAGESRLTGSSGSWPCSSASRLSIDYALSR